MTNSHPSAAKMLTVEQVAGHVGLTHRHVLRLIRAGRLGALNLSAGRRPSYRVPDQDLAAFLRAAHTGPSAGNVGGDAQGRTPFTGGARARGQGSSGPRGQARAPTPARLEQAERLLARRRPKLKVPA